MSTGEFRRLQKLLDRAVLDGDRWREAGDGLAGYLGGVGTIFVPEDLESQGPWLVHSHSLAGVVWAGFRDGWHLRNFRRKAIPLIKQRGFATDLDIADAETMRREPFYAEFLTPHKLGFFIGLHIQVGRQSWIAEVQRALGAAAPDAALFERAERVLPVLAASARASFAFGRKRLENWKDILAEQDRGLFLVDFLGRVIDRNAASDAYLKMGLRLKSRRLGLADPQADAAFQQLLASACAVAPGGSLPSPVFWRSDDDMLLVADIVRLKPNLRSFHSLEAALVVVRPVGRAKLDLAALLKRRANLTDAEVRLALALFEGRSLTEYASDVGNTVGTVRQQVKSIFRKTQTGRQTELLTWMRKLQAQDVG